MGCGVIRHQFRDESTQPVAVTEIHVDTGSGSVKVRPGEAGSVHVKRHVRYSGNRPGDTSHVDGTVLKLTGCARNCTVDYDITAPPGVRITGGTGSGDIDVANVATVSVKVGSGDVRVHHATGGVTAEAGSGDLELGDVQGSVAARTGSGNVKLSAVSGSAIAETGSGDVTAAGLHGSTTAHAGSGNVVIVLSDAQDVAVRTDSGDLKVTVPAGQRFRIDASTSSGDRHVNVTSDAGADHHLDLHTGSGNLTVSTA
jgi:hypothetical protein